jgi:hypothetical protein
MCLEEMWNRCVADIDALVETETAETGQEQDANAMDMTRLASLNER